METEQQESLGLVTDNLSAELFSSEVLSSVAVVVIFVLLLFLGSSITGGLVCGIVSSVGFGLLFMKTRKSAPRFYAAVLNYPLTADLISTLLFFTLFGSSSVVGLVSASVFGVLNTVTLTLCSKFDPQPSPIPEMMNRIKCTIFTRRIKDKSPLNSLFVEASNEQETIRQDEGGSSHP